MLPETEAVQFTDSWKLSAATSTADISPYTVQCVHVSDFNTDQQEWTLLSSELLEVQTSHRATDKTGGTIRDFSFWKLNDVVALRIRSTDFWHHFWESWTNSDLSRFREQSIVNVPQLLRTCWAIVSRCFDLQRKADSVSIKTLKWQRSDVETHVFQSFLTLRRAKLQI